MAVQHLAAAPAGEALAGGGQHDDRRCVRIGVGIDAELDIDPAGGVAGDIADAAGPFGKVAPGAFHPVEHGAQRHLQVFARHHSFSPRPG